MSSKMILLVSSNDQKLPEYQTVFSRYGYAVVMGDPTEEDISAYRAVIRDESNLFLPSGEIVGPEVSSGDAINRCKVYGTIDGQPFSFVSVVEGHMVAPAHTNDPSVFSWDDRFVPSHLNGTLHEMRLQGIKCSARELALSQFIMAHLDYKLDYNLKFQPVQLAGTVDLTQAASVAKFVSDNLFIESIDQNSLPAKLISMSVDSGIFFRLKTNGRNGNYWNPGFAGIPFTPKKDPIHEVSYLVHDFMHHLMPDLPYDGSTGLAAQNVYLISRMMSEAWSLVLADMLFIEELRKAGHVYDWGKRCIHPLYEDLSNRGYSTKDILMAVTRFVITGSYYHIPSSDALKKFVTKYTPFFAADWKWTRENWDALQKRQHSASLWIEMVGGTKTFTDLGLTPLGEMVRLLKVKNSTSLEKVMNAVFEYHYENVLAKSICSFKLSHNPLGNAIRRWALGQSAAYARFFPLVRTKAGLQKLLGVIHNPDASELDGVQARVAFEVFLEVLLDLGAISPDDFRLFKGTFPHYDPFFVSYKEEHGSVEDAVRVAFS